MPLFRLSCCAIGLAASASLPPALAHGIGAEPALAWAWNADPWLAAGLLAAAILYAGGVRRLWHSAGFGAGVSWRRAFCFGAGLAVLAAALLSPLDALGEQLFSLHMLQHELLMLAAAPLIIAGRSPAAFAWAFAPRWRKRVLLLFKARAVAKAWHALARPAAAWVLHALTVWIWHAPRLFQAGLESDAVHTLQHLSFLFAALLFWSALQALQTRQRSGAAVLYLLTTAIHTGMLGALLTFSPQPWYALYAASSSAWGLTPLQDQQLGGLIMWVPAGLVFLAAGMAAAAQALGPQPGQAPARRQLSG